MIETPATGEISFWHDPKDVSDLETLWLTAQSQAAYFSENFFDYQTGFHPGKPKRVCVSDMVAPDGQRTILCFEHFGLGHGFAMGERRLGTIRTKALVLRNFWMAEKHSPQDIAHLLNETLQHEKADLILVGEIPDDSNLRAALDNVRLPAKRLQLGRKGSLRWLINLPESFDAYLAGLSSSSRQSTKRKIRKLEKDFDTKVDVITTEDEVDAFLEAGESISKLTYQWSVGQRLRNDVATQIRYRRLAQEGRLRCYILWLDGVPKAFLRGTLEGKLYHYETPGFDPAFARNSIGQYLLLKAVEELIENTDSQIFDFGVGGGETGYKSTYGNHNISCASHYVIHMGCWRGLTIYSVETVLNGIKRASDYILPKGETRNRIKQMLRRYGSGK